MPQTSDDKLKILLTEYQKSQDSAQHFDNLIWTSAGISFAAIGGIIISSLESTTYIKIALFVSGIIILIFESVFISIFKQYKNLKYKRCKLIEKKLENNDLKHIETMQHNLTEICLGNSIKGSGVLYTLITFLLMVLSFLIALNL